MNARFASGILSVIPASLAVIPAQAGIQGLGQRGGEETRAWRLANLVVQSRLAPRWIPACAGMTVVRE